MQHTDISKEEVQIRGDAIYEKDIRSAYETTHKGKLCVIDIFSGDYEIDEDGIQAVTRLRERQPDAYTWTIRIGFPAAYSIGGGMNESNFE